MFNNFELNPPIIKAISPGSVSLVVIEKIQKYQKCPALGPLFDGQSGRAKFRLDIEVLIQ